MKQILTVFILLICIQKVNAQSLSLFDVDASNFPTMKAKFLAFDTTGKQQKPGANVINLTENGIPQTINSVNCPNSPALLSISSVLVVDVSGSMVMPLGTGTRMELVKKAASAWVNYIPLETNECAVVSFDNLNYLNQDFTRDRPKLLDVISKITPMGGTDYNAAFINPSAGSLLVSSKGYFKKVIVFLTDGYPQSSPEVTKIINEAKRQNCVIYCFTIGIDAPQSVKDIAIETGGEYFENLKSVEEAENLYRKIQFLVRGGLPCEITWTSTELCKSNTRSLELAWQNKTSISSYSAPSTTLSSLQVRPSFVSFGAKNLFSTTDTTITLTARNHDFTVNAITRKLGSANFTVEGTTFPLIIPKGKSAPITLRFTPIDSSLKYCSFEVVTDVCPAFISGSGGFLGKNFINPTLKLTYPNGSEKFVVGNDKEITWEGISETDKVSLEYSTDAGTTWSFITTQASGLRYLWKNIPLPASTKCLIRIRQQGNGNSSTPTVLTLTGHSEGLNAVAFSPDGRQVVTISMDRTAKIWDVNTGALLFNLTGHTDDVYSAAYSPDGGLIITGSLDKTAKLWDAHTGAFLRSLTGHAGGIYSVAFSPDGTHAATGSADNTMRIWETNTGALLSDCKGHTSYVNCVTFSPDGKRIATASWDKTAKIWNVSSGNLVFTLTGHSNYVWSVAFSPDGQQIATASYDRVARLWDANTGSLIRNLVAHSDFITRAVFSPDGSQVATVSHDATAKIWNTSTGTLLHDLIGHTQIVTGIAFSPDGSQVVTGGTEGIANVWNANTGSFLKNLTGHGASVTGVAYSSDGTHIATSSGDHTAKIWSIGSSVLQEDVSDSVFSIIKSIPASQDVDMLQCFVGNARDSVVQNFVRNTGPYPFRVDSIAIVGLDASQFQIVSGIPPFTVPEFGSFPVEFRFRPNSVGTKTARLLIITASDTLNHEIHGVGMDPIFSLLNKVIDFGKVEVNSQKDLLQSMIVKNIGAAPFTITRTFHAGPNDIDFSSLSSINNLTLKPGDTARIDLRFAPKAAGRTSGRLLIEYNGVGSPATMQLFGEGTQRNGQINVQGGTFPPFKCENEKVDTIRIKNTGIGPLEVYSATIEGINSNDFQLLTPFTFLEILPGTTFLLPIRFSPSATGTRTASLVLRSNSITDTAFALPLSGISGSSYFITNVQKLDLGSLCPNETKDTVLTLINAGIFRNTFHIQSPNLSVAQTDITLNPGESLVIAVHFAGQTTEGMINETLRITDSICGQQKNIQITGVIRLPNLVPQPVADFGAVVIGFPDTIEVIAVNKDTRPVQINQPGGIAPPFSFVSMIPPAGSMLLPNDTLRVSVRYVAKSELQNTGQLVWVSSVPLCVGNDTTELRGRGLSPDSVQSTVYVENISAQAGEHIPLMLKLSMNAGSPAITKTDWHARISYNKTVLFNEQTNNICTAGTPNSCSIELNGTYDGSDILSMIPCIATLGNTDNSTIYIDEFTWINSGIVSQTQNGNIRITGICEQGGVRLFIPGETSTAISTRPNPAQNSMEIHYGLREPLSVTLELLNITGRVEQTILSNQAQPAGQYTITSDLSGVGNGVYALRLTTNKEVLTMRVDVVK